ncbi:MAG: InlB B-repeat-containing protein [Roseburia inulinivorans]|uniref:InlB B-repeat-containing protein n=1 Tax=Roseburia inulinivorans TaxID=360807 RepID=UPI0039924DE9
MRKAWKKAVSVLLTLVLIFGVLPAMNVSAEGEGGQGSRSIELNFAGTVNGSTVTYDVEGTDVALTVEGAELNDSKVSISEGNLGSVKFKLENFDPDKMQIRVYSNDGFQTYLTVNQNETSLAEREGEGGFPDSITLVVEKKGSQGQPGQSTDNRIRLQLEGDACNGFADMVSKDIQIYVSKDGGSSFSQLTGLDTNSTKEYVFEADITSVKFYVSCDETKYSLQFPGKSGDAGKSEQTAIALNAAGTQHIQIDHSVRTITWAYDRQTYGEDAYLEHGKAQVVAVEGVDDLYNIPFASNPGDEKGGHIAVEAGKQVTVRLTPDYGYQLTGVTLNGGVTLAPQAEVFTFTFTMPDTNVHFKGIFKQTQDEINTSGTKVFSASVENGANAAPSGNLRLTVEDSDANTTNALAQVENAVSAEAVNLTLDQIVSKGDGTNWENPVTQFGQPVKMNLKVVDYDTAAGYAVVREHDGNLTNLPTSVSEDGTLTFETNQFSTYFIVKTAKKADNGNAKTEKSSNTSSTTASSAAGSTDNAITAQSVSGEGVPAINIASATDQLLNLAKLSEDENRAVKAGNKTQFVLSASGTTPTKEEIALIQSVLGNNVIGQYLNLNLTLKISGRADRQITDLSAPMYIAITIPQNLVNHDSSIERIYRIVRIHDGVATLIDGTYDAATNQFTFATDGFSTYALVYEDVNTTLTGRSPKTGDNSMWMVWTLILCAGCSILFAAGKRYKKREW